MNGLTLLIPEKSDIERDAVATAWEHRYGAVVRIGRFWDPPLLDSGALRVYGNDIFCLTLQQKLNLGLVTPADDLILSVSPGCVRRWLAKRVLADAAMLDYPVFVKPIVPKLFRARVYAATAELNAECAGLSSDTEILVSEVVTFAAEARCFVLDGRVLDCAIYEGDADVQAASEAVQEIVAAVVGPRTFVIDVGLVHTRGWGVIEFNATWGAGLNGCSAERVLPAIAGASRPAPVQHGAAVDGITRRC